MDRRSFLFVLLFSIFFFLFNNWLLPEKSFPVRSKAPIVEANQETLYLLQNETQQVIFSSLGGGISEINLPFQSPQFPNSLVRPISLDREIDQQSPSNDHYPSRAAYHFNPSIEQLELVSPKKGGYMPLLRRNLFNSNGELIYSLPPRFYAMQLIGESGEFEEIQYELMSMTNHSIRFRGRFRGSFVEKEYTLVEPYGISMTLRFEEGFRALLFLTSGIPEVELVSGSYSPSLEYLHMKGNDPKVEQISLPTNGVSYSYSTLFPLWISNSNGFFGTILSPSQEGIAGGLMVRPISGETIPSRLCSIDEKYRLYPAIKYPAYSIEKGIIPQKEVHYRFFAGPFAEEALEKADTAFSPSPLFVKVRVLHGWFAFISEPFARFLYLLMRLFYSISHSWGLSLIFIVCVIRTLMYPLNRWTAKSMAALKALAPAVAEIEERYKKDPTRVALETMKLYKEKKVNRFSPFVPQLIQLPFLLGIIELLKTSFELRGTSFISPSWIPNLAAPDVLFSWSIPIPYIGNQFHLLPVLLSLLTYFQQKISFGKIGKEPRLDSYIPSLLSFFIFYHFPAGVNIYWITSTLLTIAQQWLTTTKSDSR